MMQDRSTALHVVVLLGGLSAEAEISRQSGNLAAAALERKNYRVTRLELTVDVYSQLQALAPDVIFNALHGTWGEDGRVQAVCDWLRLPYTGSDVAGCVLSFNKHLTKLIYRAEGLPTPRWRAFTVGQVDTATLIAEFGLPLVIKPVLEGSSIGVHIAQTPDAVQDALEDLALTAGAFIMAEAFVRGRECTVPILNQRALPVIEMIASDSHAFYNYAAKYTDGGSRHIVPAPLPPALSEQLQALALAAHRALRLRDYSRTDILLNEANEPQLLETNALPGLTTKSLLPESAAVTGIAYDDLIEGVLKMAIARRISD